MDEVFGGLKETKNVRNPDLKHPIEHLNFSFSFSEVNPKVQHLDSIFNFLSNIPTYFHSHSVYKGDHFA